MDAIASTQRSIQAVNDILKQTSAETLKAATKMVKVNVEMQVQTPGQTGAAGSVDCFA